MIDIVMMIISVVWTGPIPHPDCVEHVDNNTVILHAEPTTLVCGFRETLDNRDYYQALGYNVTQDNLHLNQDGSGTGTMTMEKIK